MLRAIPNLNVFRPADTIETAECWELALKSADRPTRAGALAPETCRCSGEHDAARTCSSRGGYLMREPSGPRDVTLIATGSEVEIAVAAARNAGGRAGLAAAVVSMPCWELFEEQDARLPRRRARTRRRASRSRRRSALRLGPLDRRARRLRRHDRLRRPRPAPDPLPRISASPPEAVAAGWPASIVMQRGVRRWPASPFASSSTMPPSTATACRPSTSTTWSRASPSWRRPRPRRAGHHPGHPRRPLLCQRHHAGQDDRRAGGDVSANPALHAPGPRQRRSHLPDRHPARLHIGDDGRLADGGRQDAGRLRLQRRHHRAGGRHGALGRRIGRRRARRARLAGKRQGRGRGRPRRRRRAVATTSF